jgi:hypothetical protein
MPAINANIVVEQTTLTLSPTTTQIGVTVDPINLTVYPSLPQLLPGGAIGELQYKVGNSTFGGLPNSSVSGGTLTFSNLANLKIDGGTNGYVLQTDGTGTLAWTAQGGAGTGNPGGSNTQIQFNDAGLFGGDTGFTYNNASGIVNMPTDLNVVSDITTTSGMFTGDGGGISNIAAGNIVGLNTSSISNGTSNVDITTSNGNIDLAVDGSNVARFSKTGAAYPAVFTVQGNINAFNDITAEPGALFVGDGGVLSNVTAVTAGTVTTAAQPNITTIGTLTSLNVAGTTTIQQAKEKVVQNATAATGTLNYDLLTSAIVLQTTDALANFTLNFRGNASTSLNTVMSVDESMTCTFINKNGASAYFLSVIQIDGVTQTIKWVQPAGPPSVGTVGGNDMYNINIIKTAASTYSVFVNQIGYL